MNNQCNEEQVRVSVEELPEGDVLVTVSNVTTSDSEQALLEDLLIEDLAVEYLKAINSNQPDLIEEAKLKFEAQQEKLMRDTLVEQFVG